MHLMKLFTLTGLLSVSYLFAMEGNMSPKMPAAPIPPRKEYHRSPTISAIKAVLTPKKRKKRELKVTFALPEVLPEVPDTQDSDLE